MNSKSILLSSVLIVGIGCGVFTSCTNEEMNADSSSPNGNSFVYNGEESPIKSVVYTAEEDGTHTFYLSPTSGLANLDAVLLADDYIMITTEGVPGGEVSLTGNGNSLVYENVSVSAANASEVASSSMTLNLTSSTTLVMSLDASMKSGDRLQAEYNGVCVLHEEETVAGADINLTEQGFGYYMGTKDGVHEYYILLSDCELSSAGGTQVTPTTPGYLLYLDYFGDGDTWKDLPFGTFTISQKKEAGTYFQDNSGVIYFDGTSTSQVMPVTSDIVISQDENGIVTIKLEVTDVTNGFISKTVEFVGELRMSDGTLSVAYPQYEEDMEFTDSDMGSGIYYGDIYGEGSGCLEVLLYDWPGANNEENGSAMTVMFVTPTFSNKDDVHIPEGTYTISNSHEVMTCLPASEMFILGGVVPFGTYLTYADGSQTGLYGYVTSGTVTVSVVTAETAEVGHSEIGDYRFDFDLETITGHKITGYWADYLDITWIADGDVNDGTTTLEQAKELELDYITHANMYTPGEIYVGALGDGFIPVTDIWQGDFTPLGEPCGYQMIDIGSAIGFINDEGNLVPGDVLRVELLVDEGTELYITPGTYEITPNRYPRNFKPGAAPRGYANADGINGTRLLEMERLFENENLSTAAGYAAIYDGTVTVSLSDKGENWFKFEIAGEDVLHHKITGTWEGPVMHGNSTTDPVLPNPEDATFNAVKPASDIARLMDSHNLPSGKELKYLLRK